MALTIIGLSGLFFLGHFLNRLFEKTKIPDLLILIILGFMLGPAVFSLIDPEQHLGQAGSVLATITLIIILYEGGLRLSLKDLISSSRPALILSFLSFLSIATISAILLWPVLSFWPSILVGIGIGSTSSAIVIPMVKPLSIQKQTKTILTLESAFTDVLTIVGFLALLEWLMTDNKGGGSFVLNLGSTPVLSIGIGILSGLIWAYLRKKGKWSKELFASEAWALLSYGVLEFLSLNGALGVLCLGFTLGNIKMLPAFLRPLFEEKPVPENELSILSTVTFLLRSFFFLYLGLLIQIQGLGAILWAILFTALIFITRYVCIWIVFRNSNLPKLDAVVSVAMGPRGLACAVLATLPLQRGLENGEWIQNLIFAIIPFSILLTSILVSISEKDWFKSRIRKLFNSYKES